MSASTPLSIVLLIATIIRDAADPSLLIAAHLIGAGVESQNDLVRFCTSRNWLGEESRLILMVALETSIEEAGNRASRCKAGGRTARLHLGRFDRYCEAHEALEAIERTRALAA